MDAAIADLAARQYGVVSLGQLVGLGLSASAVRTRVARGSLHRIHRGVYAVGHRRLTREGHWMAAVLACGPGAMLSHRAAAERHRFVARGGATLVDVTVPGHRSSRAGIRVHLAGHLADVDRMVVGGIPVTSPSRTLLDLAAHTRQETLASAVREAEILELLDLRALRALLARSRGARGAARLRAALDLYEPLANWTRSELERRFIDLCRAARLPDPRMNAWIDLPGGGVEADFSWPARRLIVETDGRRTHGTASAFERDRRRDQRLVSAGWTVVRFTWRQVAHEQLVVRSTLGQLFRAPTGP